MIYRLTIYEANDTSVWVQATTNADDANPWLQVPTRWAESEIDFTSGSASIGEIVLGVVDYPDPAGANQSERLFTERLADSSGRSALSGRRAVLEDSHDGYEFRLIFEGVISRIELQPSMTTFAVHIRDIRERERGAELFRATDSCSVLPAGVINGYGIPYPDAPVSDWLVPPTEPLIGTFEVAPGILGTGGAGGVFLSGDYIVGRTTDGVPIVRQEVVVSDAAAEVMQSVGGPAQVDILWRPKNSTGAFTVVSLDSSLGAVPVAQTYTAWVGSEDGRQVTAASFIYMPNSFGGLTNTLPTNGQEVEVIVRYIGQATENWPQHIEGVTVGELIRDIYDGAYGSEPTRVRYNEASLLALTTPVRIRVTAPVPDARQWIEANLFVAAGAAPAIIDGEVHAVTYELPPADVDVVEIGNAEADAVPGWAQSATDAVNVVEVRYKRDRSLSPDDPGFETAAGDRIVSRDITIERRVPEAVSIIGEKRVTFTLDSLRAIGGPAGEAYSGDVADETAAQVAARIAQMMTDRFALGGQTLVARADRTDPAIEGLEVGDWVVVTTTWTPDYQSRKRGGNRLGQIIARRDQSPIRTELTILDAGPDAQPLTQPTIGTLAQDYLGRVTVPITSVPSGAEARVDYAISSSQPGVSSGLWTFAGRAASGNVITPQLPSGKRVWIRARSEAPGRRPSGYINPVSILLDATPRLRKIFAYVTGSGVEIHWVANTATAGVRIDYVEHPFGETPDFSLGQTVDADVSPKLLVDQFTRAPNSVLSFRVTPYPTFSGGTVSGTPGVRLESSVFLGVPNAPFGYVIASYALGVVDFFAQGNNLSESGAWAVKIGTPPTAPDDPEAEATGVFEGTFTAESVPITDPAGSSVWVGVWFYPRPNQQGTRGPRVLARALDDLVPLLFNFREIERTETTITYGWTRTASVQEVWVYTNQIALPQTEDPWPGADDLPDTILTSANTYTVTIPPEGFGKFLQFEPRTANLQAGSVWRLVVSAEGEAAAVSLSKTTETEDRVNGVGRLGVTVFDPDGVATALRYRTKEGSNAWSSLQLETATPVDGVEYARTVPLVEGHLSFVEYWLEFTVGTKNGVVIATSAGFDAGAIPDIVAKGHVRQSGQVFAQISGDSDTKSVKVVAFREGEEPGDIPAAVRAATALNGREVTSGNLLDQPLVRGERATVYAFGYSEPGGAGFESSALAQDEVELRTIIPAYFVPVTAEERRDVTPNVGYFEVRLEDPDTVATRVRSKIKETASSGAVTGVSAWTTETSNPSDQQTFNRTVPLLAGHSSQVIFEVQSNIAGQSITQEIASPPFDLGQIPDLVLSIIVQADGAASVQWTGDYDTRSVKVAAWLEGNEPVDIPATVRAASAINARAGQTGTLVTATREGQGIFAAAFGYAEEGAQGYEGELEQVASVYWRTDVPDISTRVEYEEISGVPNARVIATVTDPLERGRAVDPMTAYTATGPIVAIPPLNDAGYVAKAIETSGPYEGSYVWEVPLTEKHLSVAALAYYWEDADETERVVTQVLWLDVGDDPDIVAVTVSYDGRVATVAVKGDADTVELYAEESDDGDPSGTWYPVVSPTPAFTGDRFATNRRGAFSVVTRTDRRRFFRIYGKNADDRAGAFEFVQVDRASDLIDTEVSITGSRWDRGRSTSTDLTDRQISVDFEVGNPVRSVRISYGPTEFTGSPIEGFRDVDVDGSTNPRQLDILIRDSGGAVVDFPATYAVPTQVQITAYNATGGGGGSGTVLGQDFRVLYPSENDLRIAAQTGTDPIILGDRIVVGNGLALTTSGGNPQIAATNLGTVTSVGGTGTVAGLTLSGTVTTSGNLTLGGALAVNLGTDVGSSVLPIANGGTNSTTAEAARAALGAGTVTSVGGTGTVAGLTLSGTVTGSGNLTLGGALSVNLGTDVGASVLPIANGGTNSTTAEAARAALGAGTVTSVGGTGTVAGLTLSGTVTGSGSLTLGGALSVNLGSDVGSSVLPIANGGTNSTTAEAARTALGAGTVSSVGGGDGLTGTVTTTGNLTLGTPSTLTKTSTNGVTSDSHTHALDGSIADVTVDGSTPTGTPTRAGSLWFVV